MRKTVRIPSRLYRELFEKGSDKLVATFCILKATRNTESHFKAYYSKNNKFISGYGLLRKHTGITLATLKKYVPLLIELELVNFESNGNVTLISNNASNERFKGKKGVEHIKLVPVIIGTSIVETSLNSFYVRIHSDLKKQESLIDRKIKRSDTLKHLTDPTNFKLHKKAEKIAEKFGKEISINKELVLSNNGFSLAKHETKLPSQKSNGFYWKKKLVKKGLITTKRKFEAKQGIELSEYLELKRSKSLSKREVYVEGFLCYEKVSSIKLCTV